MMFQMSVFASTVTLLFLGDPIKEMHRFTIDGGGVMYSVGGTIELSGTIGQPDAGRMSNGEIQLNGGFWFPIVPGDCNADSGINNADYAAFPECVTGPGGAYDAGCGCFDWDGDGDLDIGDFAQLGNQFSGP